MKCIRCGDKIPATTNSVKYCSSRCGRNYLKSKYRRKHKEELREKRREARRNGYKNFYKTKSSGTLNKLIQEANTPCIGCGTNDDLQIHHIRPRKNGGPHQIGNIAIFCRGCHYDFEKLTEDFWS